MKDWLLDNLVLGAFVFVLLIFPQLLDNWAK